MRTFIPIQVSYLNEFLKMLKTFQHVDTLIFQPQIEIIFEEEVSFPFKDLSFRNWFWKSSSKSFCISLLKIYKKIRTFFIVLCFLFLTLLLIINIQWTNTVYLFSIALKLNYSVIQLLSSIYKIVAKYLKFPHGAENDSFHVSISIHFGT